MKPKIEQVQTLMNQKLGMDMSILSGNIHSQENKLPKNKEENQEKSQKSSSASFGKEQTRNDGGQSQDRNMSEEKSGTMSSYNPKRILAKFAANVMGILANLLLILVYIFFFMLYREKFFKAAVGLTKKGEEDKTKEIIEKSAHSSQQYLFGRFILIIILAVLYMIGYSIAGIKYALFIALIGSLLSLIPYVGNVMAVFLAIAMSFLSGGNTGQIIAVISVFAIVQFVESYLLEPYVVGKRVDLNPVIVIVGVTLGGIVWGVMGMILSIPILGILRVVLDNIPSLNSLGYALNEDDISSGANPYQKIKDWFKQKFSN